MKKSIFTISTFLFALMSFAQSEKGKSFQKGVGVANLGVGIGNFYWGSGTTNTLGVNPTISYEKAVSDKFSVGGNISFSGASFSSGGYKIKYTGILVGPRSSFHFATSDKFDPYVGATLGYVIVNVSDNSGYLGSVKGSGVGLGFYLGGRYFASSSFGFHAELGYSSFSFLTGGISFKL